MVARQCLNFIFLFLPCLLFSGEFVASVNRNHVYMDENFTLNLTLTGASPQNNPYLGELNKFFYVNSQSHSSNTIVMNGQISSNVTWKITLTPQREGEAIIPSISLSTSEGVLSTSPIKIEVASGRPTRSNPSEADEVNMTTQLSKMKPYKNEPFFYTIKINSKLDLVNVKIEKFTVEDAIVNPNGEPKIYQKIADGVRENYIELSYLLIPLREGSLKIPSVTMQGETPIKRKIHRRSSFDNDYESFFNLKNSHQLKPFALSTEETIVEVQSPISSLNPWLPARALDIEEIWDQSQVLQVGEPLTRGFKISAEGITASQLPSLSDLQMHDNSAKIYADKPELREEVKDERVRSFRNELYTLIPQRPGEITLPEILLEWWDVAKNEKVTTRIPSRILQILPGIENRKDHMATAEEELIVPFTQDHTIRRDPLLYGIVGVLAILLFAAMIWAIALQKKIVRLIEKSPVSPKIPNKAEKPHHNPPIERKIKTPAKDKNEKLPDLNPT